MKFKTYFLGLTMSERDEFARRVGSTRNHLTNIAHGQKPCSAKFAAAIERESKRQVSAESLCGSVDWEYIRGTANLKAA